MKFQKMLSLGVICLGCLTSCSNWMVPTPTPSVTITHTPNSEPVSTRVTPTSTPEGPTRLRVWLPPFLNPNSETAAGSLLSARLQEFQTANSDIIVETRVKNAAGPGGLFDSLVTASAAAPAALPDLIALPRDFLEAAALKGMLLPYDSLTTSLDDPDWYPFAKELAYIQNDIYGLPFAGDNLLQVYYTEPLTTPLTSWNALIESGAVILFPAAAEDERFTLALYQANGGPTVDDQGRPMLNVGKLTEVLNFYQSAVQSGSISPDLVTQLQTDEQVWEAFNQNRGNLMATWTSTYLQNPLDGVGIASIPTNNGKPFSLANGWVWALVGREEEKRRLAVDLAEFLTESQFLAEWSQAAGFLPARPSSLQGWTDKEFVSTIDEIASSAQLIPPTDVLSSLELPLGQAAIAVIKNQTDPVSAAQAASAGLISP